MLKLCMPLPQKHVKSHVKQEFQKISLLEKCPNTEFWLIRIFVHSDRIQRFTEKISVFSLNAGKYGPEETPYLDTFHTVPVFFYIFTLQML